MELKKLKYVAWKIQDRGLRIELNRPERGNSLQGQLADEVAFLIRKFSRTSDYLVLSGRGPNFCTGADLHWMLQCGSQSRAQNIREMTRLKSLYVALEYCPIPTIASVQGKCLGGGVGLPAACDYAVAQDGTTFRLPEMSLGLIPGIIEPFLIRKIGQQNFSRWSSSSQTIELPEAISTGLITHQDLNQCIQTALTLSEKTERQFHPFSISLLSRQCRKSALARSQLQAQKILSEKLNR